MADHNFFRKKEEPEDEAVTKKIIRINPIDKDAVERICKKEGVKYTFDFIEGSYFFYINEALYPRIQKYFVAPKKEETKEKTEGKKTELGEQIGAAEKKNENSNQSSAMPKKNSSGEEMLPKKAPKDLTKDFGVLTLEEQKRLDERQAKSEEEKKTKKKRVKIGRDNQVKTRLTDNEMQLFSERVKASGMKQGDFMRECLLHEEVHVRSLTDIDAQAFGKLMEMSSDLGRIGGLIKGTVMMNKDEFGILTPTEKEKLEALIRELNTVKDDLLKVVQNLYGDS